jgi:3D (Asp-Asp-Asp) domain-containing protein
LSSSIDSRPIDSQSSDPQPSDLLARLLDPFGRLAWAPPHRVDEPPAVGGAADIRWYNGRPIRPVRIERMRVTAYSPDERSCGDSADGITASGYSVSTNGGFLVAADPKVLPLGSLVSVPGYDSGEVVPVLDVGGAIKGARLDVLFPTHEEAVRWGVRALDVTIWEYSDGKPNDFKRFRRPAKRTP